MPHRFTAGQSAVAFGVLFLVIGLALIPISAGAQTGHSAKATSGIDPQSKREVRFEVVSIRPLDKFPGWANYGPIPSGFSSPVRIWEAIMIAYGPEEFAAWITGEKGTHVLNLPDWAREDMYEVNARVSDADLAAWGKQSNKHELLRAAMRDVLKERCKLVLHEEPTQVPDYKLVVQKNGARLKATPPGAALPTNGAALRSGGVVVLDQQDGRQVSHYYGASIGDLMTFLTALSDRPIQDMTGLTGRYDFTWRMNDEVSQEQGSRLDKWPINHLGLELRPGKEPGINLVIDHIEKPDPN